MPKSKRPKTENKSTPHRLHHDRRKPANAASIVKKSSKSTTKSSIPRKANDNANKRPAIVPFDVFDPILLVGEGDLSFTLSLLHDHGCASLVATTFDTKDALSEKYPQASDAIEQIQEEDQTVMHGIDATRLSSYKELKKGVPFERIFFNFPHTGGISTDVNRQVRANQALLSSFFTSSIPLLSPSGSILVTLFEAEPYTLWNIRDLGRDAGLIVRRSWKFERSVYPLYRHARTIGVVKSKSGEVSETAWKGEERAARTYEFGLKDGEATSNVRKRRKGESDDDDDSDA